MELICRIKLCLGCELLGLLVHGVVAAWRMVALNGSEFRIALEIVPQCAHELTNHDVIGVLLDNAEQEDAVVSKVLEEERLEDLYVDHGARR